MSLKERINKDLQDAMRSGDDLRKSTLRLVRTAIQQAETARVAEALDMVTRGDPAAQGGIYDQIKQRRELAVKHEGSGNEEQAGEERKQIRDLVARHAALDDSGVEEVLRKEIKQRRDSADEYTRAKRADLAEKELAEIAVLQAYLPQQMSEAEIEAEVRAIISDLGVSGPQSMSKVMPAAMSRLKGRAEGRTVNQVVTRLLSE